MSARKVVIRGVVPRGSSEWAELVHSTITATAERVISDAGSSPALVDEAAGYLSARAVTVAGAARILPRQARFEIMRILERVRAERDAATPALPSGT